MEGLSGELKAIRFMPMADEKSVNKGIDRLRGQMERLEAWFYGGETSEDKLRRAWRKNRTEDNNGG